MWLRCMTLPHLKTSFFFSGQCSTILRVGLTQTSLAPALPTRICVNDTNHPPEFPSGDCALGESDKPCEPRATPALAALFAQGACVLAAMGRILQRTLDSKDHVCAILDN